MLVVTFRDKKGGSGNSQGDQPQKGRGSFFGTKNMTSDGVLF